MQPEQFRATIRNNQAKGDINATELLMDYTTFMQNAYKI